MRLPKEIKIRETKLAARVHISVAASNAAPFTPIGVVISMEMGDGRRYAWVLETPERVDKFIEVVLEQKREAWPDGEGPPEPGHARGDSSSPS